MAIDFYELGRKTGAKTAEGQKSNFEALTGGLTNTIDDMIKASQLKTATLQAAMPQGIAIDKVPEELRAKATAFLTENKKAYTDASKVIASGINPQSQRYRDAIETINGVNTKFENLSTSLEGVALKRKAALDDPNGYSPSTSKEDRLTWGNLSNGDLYSGMTFNDDGTVNYTNSQGESKSFADFNVTPQSFEGQNTFLALNDKFTSAKYSGKSDQWSMHAGEAEVTVNALFQKLKPAGQKDMMMGDIGYLEKVTGFKSGTDEYENAINGILENPNDAIAGYKQHMLQTLENNYNAQKGPKAKSGAGGSGDGKFGGWGQQYPVTKGTENTGVKKVHHITMSQRRDKLDNLQGFGGEHGIYEWDPVKKMYKNTLNDKFMSIKDVAELEGLVKPGERAEEVFGDNFEQNKKNKENADQGFATITMLEVDEDDDAAKNLNSHFGLNKKSKYMFAPFSYGPGMGTTKYGMDGVMSPDAYFTDDILLYDPKTNEPYREDGEIVRFKTGENANDEDLQKINKILKGFVQKQAPTTKYDPNK